MGHGFIYCLLLLCISVSWSSGVVVLDGNREEIGHMLCILMPPVIALLLSCPFLRCLVFVKRLHVISQSFYENGLGKFTLSQIWGVQRYLTNNENGILTIGLVNLFITSRISVIISMSFVHRDGSIWKKNPFSNVPWVVVSTFMWVKNWSQSSVGFSFVFLIISLPP